MELNISYNLDNFSNSHIKDLIESCNSVSFSSISYPYNDEDCMHILAYEENTLIGAMPVCRIDERSYEVMVWVRPERRRRGIFKALYREACSRLPKNSHISLPASEETDAVKAAAACAGAALSHTELSMEGELIYERIEKNIKDITERPGKSASELSGVNDSAADILRSSLKVRIPPISDTDSGSYDILADGRKAGKFRAYPVSEKTVCFYDFKINTGLRGQGLGKLSFAMAEKLFYSQGFRRIILQVSEANAAAVKIYKNCGLKIKSRVLYYDTIL